MKTVLLVALVILLAAFCLQAQSSLTAEFGGGVSLPIGVTNDHARTGFSFEAAAGPRLNPHLSALLDFAFHGMNVNVMENASNNTRVDAQMYIWSLTVNPNYEFIKRERFSSYATGGYGLYYRWLELTRTDFTATGVCDEWWDVCVSGAMNDATFPANRSTYKGGFNAGMGASFGYRKKLFGEIRYHRMFTANRPTEIVPIVFGVRW